MKNQILLALSAALVANNSSVSALEAASPNAVEDTVFDAQMKKVSNNGDVVTSRSAFFEAAMETLGERRSKINADEENHKL